MLLNLPATKESGIHNNCLSFLTKNKLLDMRLLIYYKPKPRQSHDRRGFSLTKNNITKL